MLIILPNTLFPIKYVKKYCPENKLIIWEHPTFFTLYKYHKAKLLLHRETMLRYAEYLQENGIKSRYIGYDAKSPASGEIFDTLEHTINLSTSGGKINYKLLPSPMFLLDRADLMAIKPTRHSFFYKLMIERLGLPFDKSLDAENRLGRFPDKIPPLREYEPVEADYIERHFPNNPGECRLIVPTTRRGAVQHLRDFIKHKLQNFGPYEDASREDVVVGFHSLLAPLMNIGLLTVREVLAAILAVKGVRKSSLEGFIRQLIWREYMACVYLHKRSELARSNILGHDRRLPLLWRAPEMRFLDEIIAKVWKYGYAHHIERLMFLGNYLMLCGYSPRSVFVWFQSMFIDSYHVFMYGNVYGMSQFNAGRAVMSRHYLCSTNYIKKMRADVGLSAAEERLWNRLYRKKITEIAKL